MAIHVLRHAARRLQLQTPRLLSHLRGVAQGGRLHGRTR